MNIHISYRARGSSIMPAVLALVLSAGCSGDRPEFGPRPAPESDAGVSGEGTSSTSNPPGEGGATEDSGSSDTTTTTSGTGEGSGEDGSDGETTSNGGDVDEASNGDTSDTETKEPSGGSDTDTDTADTGSEEPDTDTDTSDTDTGEPDTETSDTETEEQDASTAPEDDTSSFDCDPDTTRSCSDDDAQGTCGTGTQTCGEDGTWGDCIALAAEDTCEPGNEDGARCGDGVIDENESCDEGESAASGGCVDCAILEGWECDGEPSECVAIEAPVIQSFLTSAVSVPGGGGKVQLSWSVADADSLRIESDQPGAPGEVTGNVVEVDVQADTTFTLVADNEGGRSEDSLVVEVNSVGDPDILVQFGSTEHDEAMDLAVQSDGALYVVGYTQGDMDGKNSGEQDAFLVKFSASGAHYWTRQMGTDSVDVANSVAVADDGSIYIAGSGVLEPASSGGCFLAKYSDDGALEWSKQRDGGSGCAVAVYGSAPYLCSAGAGGTHITAFSSQGVPGWSRSVDFVNADYLADCVADVGGVYAVGDGLNIGGGPMIAMGFSHEGVKLWSLEWSASERDSTRGATSFDGSLYVAATTLGEGDIFATSAGGNDPIVARRSTSDGELLDGVQFGSSGYDSGEDVAIDLRGNVLVVGSAGSSLRPGQSGRHFVTKRTQDNQEIWTRQFGPTDDSGQPTAVVVAPNGTVVVAGRTNKELSPDAPGGSDAYLYIFK